jgi:hypothetical protein
MWREEGARAFTRGLSACLLRSVPANAALFLAVEQARLALAPSAEYEN